MSVLDAGCGTGSITAGIAEAVGPQGSVAGVDRDEVLLEIARSQYALLPNLRFEQGDATALPYRAQFDIVSASRVLQWISSPFRAVQQMAYAARSGGTLVVLDYNHARNEWKPEPPSQFLRFYRAFLDWRHSHEWDNLTGDHLPGHFRAAGLLDVQSHNQDEVSLRGEPDFAERAGLWAEVIQTMGPQMAAEGLCTELQLREAQESYESFVRNSLIRQALSLRAVTGLTG